MADFRRKFKCGDCAALRRSRNFVIDEGVVEASLGGVVAIAGKIESGNSCPVNCAQTHGAGFAAGIEFAASQLIGAQSLAGGTYGNHFGVGAGVIRCGDNIDAGCHKLAVFHHNSSEGAAATDLYIFERQFNGASHPFCLC